MNNIIKLDALARAMKEPTLATSEYLNRPCRTYEQALADCRGSVGERGGVEARRSDTQIIGRTYNAAGCGLTKPDRRSSVRPSFLKRIRNRFRALCAS